MTKFILKDIDPEDNVNISKVSPIKELFVLLGGLLGILVVIYIALGFLVNAMVDRMPEKIENLLVSVVDFIPLEETLGRADTADYVQTLLDDLAGHLNDGRQYDVYVVDDENVNAFALPGGNIIVLSGLLKEAQSENELAMVLAHELGHYYYKDHLKGLGRGLVFAVLSTVMLGTNNGVTNFVTGLLTTVDFKFSRNQELAADEFALELLNKKYGHVAGATDFFERIHEKENMPKWVSFFSTHPLGQARVEEMQRIISQKEYKELIRVPIK
jgi:predicted Zn-dependent protease